MVIAITFSDASGGINTSNLGVESTKIYTRLVLSAMTINAILPKNKINKTQLWDFPSVATLARAFIETCHRYLYLSQPGINETEAEFRISLFFYHMNSEKYRLYNEFDAEKKVLEEFEAKLPQAKVKLLALPIYSALSKYKAEKIRRGNSAMHFTDDEIANQFSLVGGHFKPIYRLLSNHCHGSPFATYSQSNERGRGFENKAEKDYMVLALQLLNQYLSKVIISQVELLSLLSVSPESYEYAKSTFERE